MLQGRYRMWRAVEVPPALQAGHKSRVERRGGVVARCREAHRTAGEEVEEVNGAGHGAESSNRDKSVQQLRRGHPLVTNLSGALRNYRFRGFVQRHHLPPDAPNALTAGHAFSARGPVERAFPVAARRRELVAHRPDEVDARLQGARNLPPAPAPPKGRARQDEQTDIYAVEHQPRPEAPALHQPQLGASHDCQ